VVGPHGEGFYNHLDDISLGRTGDEGNLLSISRAHCFTATSSIRGEIGMYRWVLASPTELYTFGVSPGPCMRDRFLKAGVWKLDSRSEAGLP
jgi:hypothetical protein